MVAEIIDLPPLDPEAPGPFRHGEADKLLTLLGRAGYGELDVLDWRGVLPIGGGLPAAKPRISHSHPFLSSLGELLAEAGNEALNDARQSLTVRLSRHQQDGAVRMDACVHIFTGARLG